ncbi:phenylalanine--tRNA ligase subunit beta [Atopobium fossor]|uniref:phenylalanine--tRNA ligase subunit beta n=1 Tax=Atopobium fossor TaxID=39487 RepID=UPI00041D2792|nr:phenylalanine--tRNA ligase subunit beta [Atopobium fossor]
MRISYEWLKSMVELPENPDDLCREFVRTGTEVETVEKTGANLDHVVTGRVVSKTAHPNSDHMWLTQINVGNLNVDEHGLPAPLQIVCGAQNFNEGDHIIVAMIGAELPGGIKIKKSKLRGVDSYGMNCSLRELGLAAESNGIAILPADAPVGMPIAQYLGLSDVIIDAEITPNRPDCLSMRGIAVEVGAIYNKDVHFDNPTITDEKGPQASDLVSVEVVDSKLCPRYAARVVRNVKIGPSPEWLARRVMAAGARTINNVVDITNYVMYLTGQPLHAFDLDKVTVQADGKRHIVVRAAHEGEKLTTLDEQERTLTSDMAVITDNGQTPLALAGVMGGLDSEVTSNTVDVLLESAVFNAGHISRTSRNLDLMSEASIRYERKVDPTGCVDAANIAAALFEQCCDAEVCSGVVDCVCEPFEPVSISLRPDRVRALCGAPITNAKMETFLTRLGCKVDTNSEPWNIIVPSNRPDLTREADLVEEVLRLWGMDRVEPTLPAARNHHGGLTTDQVRVRQIGATLRACGLNETSTYCFADHRDLELLNMPKEDRGLPVVLLNPLVADQSEMRRSMLPGLLRSVAYNLDHGVANVALYEIGRCFFGSADASQPAEPSFVAGVLCGENSLPSWNVKPKIYDFFDAKGIVEQLLKSLRIQKVRFVPADSQRYSWLQPGRSAQIFAGKDLLGWIGNVHPTSLAHFGIDADVVAFELAQDVLLSQAVRELPYQEVPTLPGVTMDIALLVNEDVTAETLMQRVTSAGGKLLAEARLFDIYRDPLLIAAGKKSMTVSLVYRAVDHTLSSSEVEAAHSKLIEKLKRGLGAELRG